MTRLRVWGFKLACWLLLRSTGLRLVTVGMTTQLDRVTMMIFSTPGLAQRATDTAAAIAAAGNDEIVSGGVTVH